MIKVHTLDDPTFTVYVGRGKGGHAKNGKPRYIFFDMTGTGADHDRLDKILSKLYETNQDRGILTRQDFINKMRKAISSLASLKGAPKEGELAVNCCGEELRFNIIQYVDPEKMRLEGHLCPPL